MSHGQNEQQDGWNGFTAMTARDPDLRPEIRILGETSAPSQVWVGGNSRKSSLITSGSMEIYRQGGIKQDLPGLHVNPGQESSYARAQDALPPGQRQPPTGHAGCEIGQKAPYPARAKIWTG